MRAIPFVKYQATGNDFILIDNRKNGFSFTKEEIQKLCHRQLGIGSDGLILLESTKEADFEMKYFNPDGSSDMMCGNGGRCIVSFAQSLSIINKTTNFLAPDGIHSAEIISQKNNKLIVKLSLRDVEEIIEFQDGKYLNTGTNHFVKEVEDISQIDIIKEGREVRYDERFEKYKGVNANFIQVLKEGELKIRTYERGVEKETLSCGTGVTASAIAYSQKHNYNNSPISLHSQAGLLKVFYTKTHQGFYTDIFLEGLVEKVFEGVISI